MSSRRTFLLILELGLTMKNYVEKINVRTIIIFRGVDVKCTVLYMLVFCRHAYLVRFK